MVRAARPDRRRPGHRIYLFDKERTETPACYGECAAVWPPVLTKGEPRAGTGVAAAKLPGGTPVRVPGS